MPPKKNLSPSLAGSRLLKILKRWRENRPPVVERFAFTTGQAFRSGSRLSVGQARRGPESSVRIFSNRHLQVLHSAKLKGVASPPKADRWYFPAILKAFLKSHASVRSAMRNFEPIFLRKSRPPMADSCSAYFSAWLTFNRWSIIFYKANMTLCIQKHVFDI